MKPIAIIAIIAAVVVVGGACAGVAFSGVLNGGTTGPGGDDPVVPTDPVEPTPTETPTETPTPTPTDSSMSYFSPMTSSSSGSSKPSHVHTWDEGVVTTEPTCDVDGVKTFTCSECQETKTEAIPATGHTWNDGVETTAPTCEDEGVKTFTCSECQGTKTEAIPVTGHNYQAVTLKTIDTDSPIGVRYICSVCGGIGEDIVTETVAATIGTDYFETIDNALAAAGAGDVVNVKAGTYTLPGNLGKEIIISGTKDTIFDLTTPKQQSGSSITFDGVTLLFDNDGYEGQQHSVKEVYKNCAINGTMFLYAPEVVFEKCTFEMYNEVTEYSVWTYGAEEVTFTDCTFNTHGKAVLVYIESETHANITLNNCEFYSDSVYSDKAAVEVGSSPYSTATTYNIYLNGCKQTGFIPNKSDSPLWGNKNSMDKDHLNVVIDGKDVY